MKKIIFTIAILFSVCISSVNIANATESSVITPEMLEKAKTYNYGVDNYVIVRLKSTNEIFVAIECNENNKYGSPINSIEHYASTPWKCKWNGSRYIIYSPSDGYLTLMKYDESTGDFTTPNLYAPHAIDIPSFDVLYANKSIYYVDGEYSGTLFFKAAPPLSELAQVVEKARPEMTVQQILMILPIMMVCLVGFLALRKALQIFHRLLSKA